MKGKRTMIETILFDLSEVYIQGILGVEKEISSKVGMDQEKVRASLQGEKLIDLFEGKMSENVYLARTLAENGYPSRVAGHFTSDIVKDAIRNNFKELPGTKDIIEKLNKAGYKLGLLSDHAREWIEHIESVHPLAQLFPMRCYSFEIGYTKKSPESFKQALARLKANPETTLFIDDRQVNLEVAGSVGIRYLHHFSDAASFASALPEFGIKLD